MVAQKMPRILLTLVVASLFLIAAQSWRTVPDGNRFGEVTITDDLRVTSGVIITGTLGTLPAININTSGTTGVADRGIDMSSAAAKFQSTDHLLYLQSTDHWTKSGVITASGGANITGQVKSSTGFLNLNVDNTIYLIRGTSSAYVHRFEGPQTAPWSGVEQVGIMTSGTIRLATGWSATWPVQTPAAGQSLIAQQYDGSGNSAVVIKMDAGTTYTLADETGTIPRVIRVYKLTVATGASSATQVIAGCTTADGATATMGTRTTTGVDQVRAQVEAGAIDVITYLNGAQTNVATANVTITLVYYRLH